VAWGDYAVSAAQPNSRNHLKWLNWRSRLSQSKMRCQVELNGPTGEGIYSFFDAQLDRKWHLNSLFRGPLYQGGVLARSESLAKSYGLQDVSFSDGDIVLDVGANLGDLAVWFEQVVRSRVRYIGFEPASDEFLCLTMNTKLANALLIEAAVGSVSGTQIFYHSPDGADSSLEQPPSGVRREYEVSVLSLNDFCETESLAGHRIRLLKLEAEGTEMEVLEGADDVLDRVDFIAVDMGFERGINQESPAPEIIPFLLGRDFEILRISDAASLRFLFRNCRS
jgi:FkbM family methyltransferase